jgi:ubiquinone/menaquinone biosynthesis C-methylase UbiE
MIYAQGFYAVWTVYLGKKHGLFQLIDTNPGISPASLAEKTQLYLPAVEGWCSSAVCLGYLRERKGGLMMDHTIREVVINEESRYYAAGQFAYSALRSLEYTDYDALFKRGEYKAPISPHSISAIEEATAWDHRAFLESIRTEDKRIHLLLRKGCKVLDVGCGVGKFMQRVQQKYPESSFVGIDLYAAEINATNRPDPGISILPDSAETMRFEEEFDLIYFGEALYLVEDKQKAIANCFKALRKGGAIAILEGLRTEVEGCKICEQDKMVMAMQLDFVLQGHPFMKKNHLLTLLRDGGFRDVRFTHLGASFFLVTAIKK